MFRYLLPLSIIGGIILMAGGAIDNFANYHTVTTLSGGHQTIVGGPVASQEVIKDFGNNGGGFFNANSAHPFENPNPFTNLFEIFLLLVIPFARRATFGKMVKRQPAGLRAARGHGGHLAGRGRRYQLLRGPGRRDGPATRARRHGGQAGRRFGTPGSLAVRGLDHGHLDRSGELLP